MVKVSHDQQVLHCVVTRILDLEFIEMAELTIDDDLPATDARAPSPNPSSHHKQFTEGRKVLPHSSVADNLVPRRKKNTQVLCPPGQANVVVLVQ